MEEVGTNVVLTNFPLVKVQTLCQLSYIRVDIKKKLRMEGLVLLTLLQFIRITQLVKTYLKKKGGKKNYNTRA